MTGRRRQKFGLPELWTRKSEKVEIFRDYWAQVDLELREATVGLYVHVARCPIELENCHIRQKVEQGYFSLNCC